MPGQALGPSAGGGPASHSMRREACPPRAAEWGRHVVGALPIRRAWETSALTVTMCNVKHRKSAYVGVKYWPERKSRGPNGWRTEVGKLNVLRMLLHDAQEVVFEARLNQNLDVKACFEPGKFTPMVAQHTAGAESESHRRPLGREAVLVSSDHALVPLLPGAIREIFGIRKLIRCSRVEMDTISNEMKTKLVYGENLRALLRRGQ